MREKSTTSPAQQAYMEAKAYLQVLEERVAAIEKEYIATNAIRNADGTIPAHVYCIDDQGVFDRANEETAAQIVACGLEADINVARSALTKAEDDMIAYGISIAPPSIRTTLERGVKESYTTRQKIIDLVFRLDTSTVSGGAQT